jgi:hypothetical protein
MYHPAAFKQDEFKKYNKLTINRFNLARLLMDILKPRKSPGDVMDALEDLPVDQDSFYGRSLERIREQGDSKTGFKVIAWILFAKRQLKMEELLEAVASSLAESPKTNYRDYLMEPQALLESCAGLVVYEQESEIVRFAHLTVGEYLMKRARSVDVLMEYATFAYF